MQYVLVWDHSESQVYKAHIYLRTLLWSLNISIFDGPVPNLNIKLHNGPASVCFVYISSSFSLRFFLICTSVYSIFISLHLFIFVSPYFYSSYATFTFSSLLFSFSHYFNCLLFYYVARYIRQMFITVVYCSTFVMNKWS